MKALDRLRKLEGVPERLKYMSDGTIADERDDDGPDFYALAHGVEEDIGPLLVARFNASPALLAVAEAAEEWRVADEEYREAANRRAVGELIVMRRVRAEAALRAALARLGSSLPSTCQPLVCTSRGQARPTEPARNGAIFVPMLLPKIPAHVRRELTVAASVDPKTLDRYFRGEPVRGLTEARIEKALAERGIEPRRPTPREP